MAGTGNLIVMENRLDGCLARSPRSLDNGSLEALGSVEPHDPFLRRLRCSSWFYTLLHRQPHRHVCWILEGPCELSSQLSLRLSVIGFPGAPASRSRSRPLPCW